MYELCIHERFSSAHQLRGYKGKCENLHGHNWKVEVRVRAEELNSIGLAMDFHDLKAMAREIVGSLDHGFLNDKPAFRERNPSSENIAKWIFGEMSEKLKGEQVRMMSVTVWESDTASATYHED